MRAMLCQFFRGHALEFVRNIYGDEINVSAGRSLWQCVHCGAYVYGLRLYPEERKRPTVAEIQESMTAIIGAGARTDDQLAWITTGARIAQRHHAIIEMMREIARRFGWAIGVHGSLIRDIDLIAVPWTAEASEWTMVYDAWLAEMPLQDVEGSYRNRPPQRPHNRKSMLILQEGSERLGKHPKGAWDPPCLDVSFMVPAAGP